MQVDLSPAEMWKILDAVKAFKNDYSVSVPVQKVFSSLEKKLKKSLNVNNK
jgi:sulfur relay (sulfurtransferase) DsrC/TusE family protein